MSYLTLAVEIDHGKIIVKEPSKLPAKATGLLTILEAEIPEIADHVSALRALEALQKHLGLDAERAAEWAATVRDGRR